MVVMVASGGCRCHPHWWRQGLSTLSDGGRHVVVVDVVAVVRGDGRHRR